MNVELIVAAKPVAPHKNVYELVVDYMHGDADATTTQTHIYKKADEKRLKIDLIGLQAYPEERDDDAVEVVTDALEVAGIENAEEEAERISGNFYEGDSTCEGERCPIEGLELFFYDEHGQKFKVRAKIDGDEFIG